MTSERKKENVVRLHTERQRDRETERQVNEKKKGKGNPSLEIC